MEMFRKRTWIWKVIVIVAAVALIATTFLPFFTAFQ